MSVRSTRLRAVCGALLVAVLAAGCGRSDRAGGSPTGVPTVPPFGSESPAVSSLAPVSAGPSGASPAPTPSAPQPAPTATGFPLDVTITPSCGSVGTAMAAEIRTAPRSKLSVTVAYSDGKDHDQKGFFDADAEGRYTFRWTIPSGAPVGEGRVLVAAADESGGGDVGGWPFRVAEPGRC